MKCGSTGTGKTINCTQIISDLNESQFINIIMSFNARTDINYVQETLDKHVKRRKIGV